MTDGVRLEATRVLSTEGKIQAIKFVREKKGLGLAEAKAYVEALESNRDPDEAAKAVPATGRGCSAVVWAALVAIAALIWWLSR